LLGFEANCEAEPASGLDGAYEEDDEEEDEPVALLPPFEPLEAPCRPLREEARPAWSRTTDENGAPALCPWERPVEMLSPKVIAPAAVVRAIARRKSARGRSSRRCLKLATDAPSVAIAGIGEGSGMRQV
jgi:hypothetical protein